MKIPIGEKSAGTDTTVYELPRNKCGLEIIFSRRFWKSLYLQEIFKKEDHLWLGL